MAQLKQNPPARQTILLIQFIQIPPSQFQFLLKTYLPQMTKRENDDTSDETSTTPHNSWVAIPFILSCSVAESHPTLCDPMDCTTPGFPILHHLPEFAQTHFHWISDVIQPSHPLLSPLLLSSILPRSKVFSKVYSCLENPMNSTIS